MLCKKFELISNLMNYPKKKEKKIELLLLLIFKKSI